MQLILPFILLPLLALAWFSILLFIFTGLKKAQSTTFYNPDNCTFSIIVAARNDSMSLARLLNQLRNQDFTHENFELILVFNGQTEIPVTVPARLKNSTFEYQIHKVIPRCGWSNKKNALWHGAQLAGNAFLVFTDADCRPPATWLSILAKLCTPTTDLVMGFAPIQTNKKNLAGILSEIDALINNVSAAAGAGWQHPFMASGRNLIIRRELYNNLNILPAISHRISGDDDLLVQRLNAKNHLHCKFSFTAETHVASEAPVDLRQYFLRRGRHVSASSGFTPGVALGFALYELLRVLFMLLPLIIIAGNLPAGFLIIPVSCFAFEGALLQYFSKRCQTRFSIWRYFIWLLLSSFVSFMALIYFYFATDKWPAAEKHARNQDDS